MNWGNCSWTNSRPGNNEVLVNFLCPKKCYFFSMIRNLTETSDFSVFGQCNFLLWWGLNSWEVSGILIWPWWELIGAFFISHRLSFHSNKTIFSCLWNKLACCGWFFPLELTIDALLPLDHKTISYFTLLSMFGKCTNLIPISFHKHNKVFCDWDAKCFIGEIREKKCI